MSKYFQRLGKSLVLPVAVMPAAAILIGVGHWFNPSGLADIPITIFLINAGSAIIENIPLLFAVGISFGMTKEKDGAAALSGVISFLIITFLLSPKSVASLQGISIEYVDYAFTHIDNVFVGIISGLVAATCYNTFGQVQLPRALSFFSGKRLVPIVSSIAMIMISAIFFFVWPYLYNSLVGFGESISKLGPLGAGLYAFFNRLLIPTGLHHALNSVFWFDVAGINDIGKFWGTVQGGSLGTTGIYQAGFFPIMMFGLPGAALAMYQCARTEKKKQIASLMIAVGFSSFFTGITEPLEFLFMFTAPVLYLIHALLTGLMVFIAASCQWIAGFSFSAGLVDYLLSIRMPYANDIFMLIPLGLACGLIYYVLFKIIILKFDLMTPGREEEELVNIRDMGFEDINDLLGIPDIKNMARVIYDAIGGKENIIMVENCITRLRLELHDVYKMDEKKIEALQVGGIVHMGQHSVQIIVGTDVQFIVDEIEKLIRERENITHEGTESI